MGMREIHCICLESRLCSSVVCAISSEPVALEQASFQTVRQFHQCSRIVPPQCLLQWAHLGPHYHGVRFHCSVTTMKLMYLKCCHKISNVSININVLWFFLFLMHEGDYQHLFPVNVLHIFRYDFNRDSRKSISVWENIPEMKVFKKPEDLLQLLQSCHRFNYSIRQLCTRCAHALNAEMSTINTISTNQWVTGSLYERSMLPHCPLSAGWTMDFHIAT